MNNSNTITAAINDILDAILARTDFEYLVPAAVLDEMDPAAVAAAGARRKVYDVAACVRLVVASMGAHAARDFAATLAAADAEFLAREAAAESRHGLAGVDRNHAVRAAGRDYDDAVSAVMSGWMARPNFRRAAEALLAALA